MCARFAGEYSSVTGNKGTIESEGWELYGHVIPLFPTDDKVES